MTWLEALIWLTLAACVALVGAGGGLGAMHDVCAAEEADDEDERTGR